MPSLIVLKRAHGSKNKSLFIKGGGHADTTENMASENVVAEAPRQDGGAHELSGFAERHNVIEPEYTAQAEPSDSRQAAQEQTAPATESGKKKEENSAFWGVIMAVSSVLGVALAVFLFLYMPAFLFDLINSGTRGAVTAWRPVIEGVMKIALFVGYLSVVTMMRDIKRMFQYHGAEHKAIFCYESGKELTVENVRGFKRFHPRCGTSFMILMLLVSIVVAAVILHFFPLLKDLRILWVFIKLVVIMPLTCALGYELLRVCGRHENILTKIVSAPGMWVQRLTTKEPDDSMIEVAINALNGVIPENANADSW